MEESCVNRRMRILCFVGWTVGLSILVYACSTGVEGYRLSRASNRESGDGAIMGSEAPGARQAAAGRLWGQEESSGLLRQRFHPRRLARRKLAGARREKFSGFRMKMLHRNSAESPFRKEYGTQAEALIEDMAVDELRLAAFRRRTEQMFKRNMQAAAAAPASASPAPATTAVIEGPGASAAHDYKFQSPLVSGSTLGSGQYFVDFYLGTPPQKFSLIVDSGSDLIWVQCAPCARCYAQDGPLYAPANSSTFEPVPCLAAECLLIPAAEGFPCDFRYPGGACAYEYQYADSSSTRGVFAYETATLDDASSPPQGGNVRVGKVAFGCGTDNQGSFAAASGVVGLGQGPLSFTSQIGYAYGNKFSYCLVNYLDPTSVSSSLVFGDLSSPDQHNLQYTPILQNQHNPTQYYVQILEVAVAGECLPIPASAWSIDFSGNGGSVVDSGTTLTYFVQEAYSVVLSAFNKFIPYPRVFGSVQNLDLCFNISGVDNPNYPSFEIKLQGNAVFQLPADNYFVDVAPGVKCLAVQGVPAPPGGVNTIGNLLQQNFLVVYDRDQSRIGFAPTKCSSHL